MQSQDIARKALNKPVVSLFRALRAVAVLYDGEFPAGGPGSTQFTLLAILNDHGAMTATQLGQALAMDRSALKRDLAFLARRGLIKQSSTSGRDSRRWRLTRAGHRDLARLRTYWERAQTRLMRIVGKTDWKMLHSILDRVTQAAGES
jgi:predicted ArsR family transcriptional regulator